MLGCKDTVRHKKLAKNCKIIIFKSLYKFLGNLLSNHRRENCEICKIKTTSNRIKYCFVILYILLARCACTLEVGNLIIQIFKR